MVVAVASVFSQDPPLSPEITRVSVKPLTDTVVIEWTPSATSPIDGYTINEKLINTERKLILQINNPNATRVVFRYPPVRWQAVRFDVAAFKIYPSGPSYSRVSTKVPYHKTMFMQLKSDTCHSKVNISWSSYYGWLENLDHYNIFQIKNGVGPELVKGNISPSDTTFSADVEPNKNYCFYVCAINKMDPTITSFSNDSCLFTKMTVPPAYINADYGSFNPNTSNPLKLRFSIDPNSQLKKYQLYASDNADNGFSPVGSILNAADSLVITDNITSPKYYKLVAINNCGNASTTSNVATAMVLKGSIQLNQVNLVWNQYKDWSNGVQQYNIYRVIESETPLLLGRTSETEFANDLNALVGQGRSGYICYYVEAISSPDNLGKVNRALSSNFCIDLSESIFIPNAFTPNGDGSNDEFLPSFAFLPKDFSLIVYNRYGFKVFETHNLHQGWDGTFGNGKKAPEGTYVYLIRFMSQTGKNIERKGNVSLIYP